jgi:hypothetical protein
LRTIQSQGLSLASPSASLEVALSEAKGGIVRINEGARRGERDVIIYKGFLGGTLVLEKENGL